MGTYQYMAPEQIRGKEITPQTDLYSLGCVFFELLSGQPPFEGETAAEILHQHIKSLPPRVGQFATDCPAGLEQLVNDLLQKEPAARPADAQDGGSAFESDHADHHRQAESAPVRAKSGRTPRRRN